MKPTILAGLWRSRSVRFWEEDHLLFLLSIGFSEWAAAAIAAIGIQKRKQQAYVGLTSERS